MNEAVRRVATGSAGGCASAMSSSAEKAGGFSRDNLDIIAAVQAFNELNELSDEVRNKLVADMRKSDPMSADFQGGGNLYIGIFALMTVLVIAGGKGIFY